MQRILLGDLTHRGCGSGRKGGYVMENSKPTTPEPKASRTWERLEDFVRDHVQQFIQALLEEEVTEY